MNNAVPIPAQISDISVDWLNTRLGDDFGTITEVSVAEIGAGVGILGEVGRVTLTYAEGETGPATLIAKCQSVYPDNIVLCQMMGFYVREVSFYNELASSLDIRTPKCHVADMAQGGAPFILLVEEITDARMIDQIEGASREDAMSVAETVAGLHARFWNNDALFALEWLPPMNNDLYKGAQGLFDANWEGFVENWSALVDPDVLACCEALIPKYADMLDWVVESSPATLAHTDCRAENYLFGGSAGPDAITMLDFQLATRHVGTYDIANFLGMSVTIENRRAWENDVVRHYHDTLVARGVPDYDYDQCHRDYRYALMHQAMAQVAVANLDPGNDRGRELLNAFVTRAFTAAADNQSIDLLSEL